MRIAGRFPWLTAERLVDVFVAANLGFLAVDVFVAHAANAFASRVEWVPVGFSIIAPLLLLPSLFRESLPLGRALAFLVGAASILVGGAGMVLHLESAFFERQTIAHLVYTAPFVAPLSYVGLGLLVMLNKMERAGSVSWAGWVLFLAFGGFVGNLGLSLLDHAQNGFFSAAEWTPVVAAAFGVSFLFVSLFSRAPQMLRSCAWVMALEVLVGVLGFALHVRADLQATAVHLRDRFLFGAPAFAPLLFADLAVLAFIGLWASRLDPELGAQTNQSAAMPETRPTATSTRVSPHG